MANRWETMETVTNFIFLGSKITADGDCSYEIKRRLLLGREAMAILDSILKSRIITLLTNVHIVKTTVFPVVLYGCESWTIKKAEHQRIDAFELWCWRRLLRVPWPARRSKQSILKEINPESSLEGLMLKLNTLATWCEEQSHWKRPWCRQRLKAKGEGSGREWDGWMASSTQWTWVWANSGRWWRTGKPGVHGVTKSWTQLRGWTATKSRGLAFGSTHKWFKIYGHNSKNYGCFWQHPQVIQNLWPLQWFKIYGHNQVAFYGK